MALKIKFSVHENKKARHLAGFFIAQFPLKQIEPLE